MPRDEQAAYFEGDEQRPNSTSIEADVDSDRSLASRRGTVSGGRGRCGRAEARGRADSA